MLSRLPLAVASTRHVVISRGTVNALRLAALAGNSVSPVPIRDFSATPRGDGDVQAVIDAIVGSVVAHPYLAATLGVTVCGVMLRVNQSGKSQKTSASDARSVIRGRDTPGDLINRVASAGAADSSIEDSQAGGTVRSEAVGGAAAHSRVSGVSSGGDIRSTAVSSGRAEASVSKASTKGDITASALSRGPFENTARAGVIDSRARSTAVSAEVVRESRR